MKLSSPILRTFSYFIPKPQSHSLHTSTQRTSISNEVLNILDKVNPMEEALERVLPFLSPDIITSVIHQQPDPQLGFRFYIWAIKQKGLRSSVSQNLVIDLLIKDDGFDLYWKTLEELKNCKAPIVSDAFLVLIEAYAKSGMAEKAVESFGKMRHFGCSPNVFTYNSILHLMLQKEVLLLAMAVYNQMVKSNCRPNQATYSILIDGSYKSGRTQDALRLFDDMMHRGIAPNVITNTVILSGLCEARSTDDALRHFYRMKESGCCPDLITYNALLNGFCKLGRVDEALELLPSFEKDGLVLDLNGYSCLIDSFFRTKRSDEAHKWYRKMLEGGIVPDIVLYTIMIRGFAEAGKLKDAHRLLHEMTDSGLVPDIYCYNAVIKMLCDLGLLDKARSLQLEISRNDCFPNAHTYTILICGMCKNGLVGEAHQIFEEMEKLGCIPSVVTFNALIDGLCKAGELREANLLFCKMEIGRSPSLPSLFLKFSQGADRVLDGTSLQSRVEQYCESGKVLEAYKLLMRVADNGVAPNLKTYNILINGMCKSRMIDGALELFKELQTKGHSPDSVTYGTLIDGLQRVGREKDALAYLDEMEEKGCTSSAAYKSLMTWSCRKGRVSLAFSHWLKYLTKLRGGEVVKLVEEHFRKGEVEMAVRKLLEVDMKLRDFDLAPYMIWLIGLCQAGRLEEAVKIFLILKECKVTVTPPSCVMLIRSLCKERNFDLAIQIFLYTVEKGIMLKPQICNQLLKSLILSKDKSTYVLDLLRRMESAGYDLNAYLHQTTKSLAHAHWNTREMENFAPG